MLALRRTLMDLFADESGATAIEYGMIAGLIVVGILGAMTNFADANSANYQLLEDEIAT